MSGPGDVDLRLVARSDFPDPPRLEVADSVEGVEQVWVHLREGVPPVRVVKPDAGDFVFVAVGADGLPVSVSFLRPVGFVPRRDG